LPPSSASWDKQIPIWEKYIGSSQRSRNRGAGEKKVFTLHPAAQYVFSVKKIAAFRSKEILILRGLSVLRNAGAGRFRTLWHDTAKKACVGDLTPVQGSLSFSVLSTLTLHAHFTAVITDCYELAQRLYTLGCQQYW
jgi:hypothetical protein